MSGRLDLRTPWARTYFDQDRHDEVEALIPEGHTLTVGAKNKPGEWTLRLNGDQSHYTIVYGRDLAHLCASTLRRWARE